MRQRAKPVVAIDGPAGSGKSTVARRVAEELGFTLVDTGAIYRCVALAASQRGIDWDDGPGLGKLAADLRIRFERAGLGGRIWLDDQEVTSAIRTPEVSQGASQVSAHPQVRQALLDTQRALGRDGGVVLEGRDIGTVVFADAEIKVFLDAPVAERARRRHAELEARGTPEPFEQTLQALTERDERDRGRQVAPLRAADDAHVLDTGPLSIDQVVEHIVAIAQERAAAGS